MRSLIELNGFVKGQNGVFSTEELSQEFNYSDGEATEKLLHGILSNASDLSSNSDELQAQIVDWPTEYHLSETRANLLRPLDLSAGTRVLELGCGCGSISRYLGEQGIQVDSIEGSPIRAALAAMRCDDLPNVSICTANFNDVSIPEDYYDLVLFVGVTEYAGRFSERESDQEALNDLLKLGKRAARSNGVTLVAIENRAGLKYMHGACEDHYAIPYVGIENYPQSTGIRTYTKKEWQHELAKAGFKSVKFAYPFPDYKVPTLLISEDADSADDRLKPALSRVVSRDYSRYFSLGEQEARLWQSTAEAGTLGEHSNSFLIFMADDASALSKMANFELVEYEPPVLNYSLPKGPENVTTSLKGHAEEERLKADLAQLQAHADDLEQTIQTMSSSLGWRVFSFIRRLFGRKSIR